MEQFPHLNFVQKIDGKPRLKRGGSASPISNRNKADRVGHSTKLQRWVTACKNDWNLSFDLRESSGFAELDKDVQPVYLQINPDIINAEFDLETFGIEIISEEEDGFIIGASLDNFRTLEEKINGFLTSVHGTGKIADFWEIFEGNREDWKPKHVLSEELFSKWDQIQDDEVYKLEVSVAFNKPMRPAPNPSVRDYERKLEEYREELLQRDDLLMERESHFQNFINHYGSIVSELIQLDDCFGCEVEITGKGLKDLVINYQFVFEVVEMEAIGGVTGDEEAFHDMDLELLPPNENSVEIGIIDSGIMEGNKYLSPAIKPDKSKSYISSDTSTADYVSRGGHGTKVAGAALYPGGVSTLNAPYQIPFFVRNLRVLDANNELLDMFPAELMKRIVIDNHDCHIFNLSIGSNAPFRNKHMSTWAAVIDSLTHEKGVLFLISAGNVAFNSIKNYLSRSTNYPDYLNEPFCRLSNPAQSSFGITVGSINHIAFNDGYWESLGAENEVSGYSRVGMGIWRQIKPDVVEYGGGIVRTITSPITVKEHAYTATELIRSTMHGGNVIGKDSVGTSFATPKVAHIAARLKELYPDENVNLIRAFIAQGARLPGNHFETPSFQSIRHFGYGLPSLERVTRNSEHRITFYSTGNIKAEEGHLYSLSIPRELRGGDDYDILIEVTLAFTAQVRRTRQKTKSYLSTWLDWNSSKIGEPYEDFKDFALKEISNTATTYDKNTRNAMSSFKWKIKNFRGDRSGLIPELSRNDSSLQKDWATLKSFELPEEISFSVNGHKGWDKAHKAIPYAFTVSIEILGANIPIYDLIKIENEIEIEQEINTQS